MFALWLHYIVFRRTGNINPNWCKLKLSTIRVLYTQWRCMRIFKLNSVVFVHLFDCCYRLYSRIFYSCASQHYTWYEKLGTAQGEIYPCPSAGWCKIFQHKTKKGCDSFDSFGSLIVRASALKSRLLGFEQVGTRQKRCVLLPLLALGCWGASTRKQTVWLTWFKYNMTAVVTWACYFSGGRTLAAWTREGTLALGHSVCV